MPVNDAELRKKLPPSIRQSGAAVALLKDKESAAKRAKVQAQRAKAAEETLGMARVTSPLAVRGGAFTAGGVDAALAVFAPEKIGTGLAQGMVPYTEIVGTGLEILGAVVGSPTLRSYGSGMAAAPFYNRGKAAVLGFLNGGATAPA